MMGDLLYLSDQDIIKHNLITIDECIQSIDEMFKIMADGDYSMGGNNRNSHGMRMSVEKEEGNNLYIAMIGHLGGRYNYSGLKFHGPNRYIIGANKESNFIIILSEGDTGVPKAILQGNILTIYRTVAVSAWATQKLLVNTPRVVGIIGPGKINTEYIMWLLRNYPSIERVKVKGRSTQGVLNFIDRVISSRHKYTKIEECTSFEDTVVDSDIVSINTGFDFKNVAEMPFIRDKWIKDRTLFLCPAFVKFSEKYMCNKANLVVDNYKMYESYAMELGKPAYFKLSNLGNLLFDMVDKNAIRRENVKDIFDVAYRNNKIDSKKTTVFASGGMVIEDIAVGYDVFTKAIEKNIGTVLEY